MSTSLADRVRRAQNSWRFAPWKPIEIPEWAARLYAVALIVNGFAKEVLQQLPMEFAVEAQKLLGISLEGSVG